MTPDPSTAHGADAVIDAARPSAASGHVVQYGAAGGQLLVTAGNRLYGLDAAMTRSLRRAELAGESELAAALAGLGVEAAPPPEVHAAAVRALALTVAQTCNLACTYCYAAGGDFGGPSRTMPWSVAKSAIDRLVTDTPPGGAVRIAYMGGEPLVARDLIRRATEYAIHRAAARAVSVGFSLTTNGTLIEPADAAFFARHRFAITVSLDGGAEIQDALRPTRAGLGSFARIAERCAALLDHADRIRLSARVTVTSRNLDVATGVEQIGALGFESVGVSPLLAAANGSDDALEGGDFATLLDAMIRCGDRWVEARLANRHHPFANLETALQELSAGEARGVSCGAATSYLAVDADGDYSACHRFVRSPAGKLGSLGDGIDEAARATWLAARHVDGQESCAGCWARYLCGGGCHHEVLSRGRPSCDYIRGWLHYAIGVYGRLSALRPELVGR